MSRYAIITNIWGKEPCASRKFVWKEKDSFNYPDFFESEHYRFETLEEMNDFIHLFEEFCNTLTLPKNISEARKKGYWNRWSNENERLWGYVYGDLETRKIKWGGYKLRDFDAGSDKRQILDMLFTTEDDVPADYEWDDGEYEGWLQYRWGDGKNAVGYVEPEKPVKMMKQPDDIVDFIEDEDPWFEEEHDEDYEEIENSFLKDEDIEKLKRLAERW